MRQLRLPEPPACVWSWYTVVAGGISSASREATDERSWDRRTHLPVRGSGSQMKMPSSASLRTAAPLLCNALLVGLVIETRLELSEWHVAAGTGRHRELKDDVLRPSSPYATADDLEDLRVSLEAQLAQQAAVISSVKADAVELETKLRKRITKDRDALDQFVAAMRSEMAQLKTEPENPETHRAKPAESRRAAANTTSSARHRKQGGGSCDGASWASRTQAVTDACCPPAAGTGTGHRRAQGRSCSMPATCPSASCAAEFVPYYQDCGAELQGHADELPLDEFGAFYASCQEMQSGSGLLLQPVAVQMFRVRVSTEGVAQAGAMFPGAGGDGGGGQLPALDPLHPIVPLPPPPPPLSTG